MSEPSPAILATLQDYRLAAKGKLAPAVFDYIDGGAGDEATCRANRDDFARLSLVPRTMRDVSTPDIGWSWQEQHYKIPLGISPTAFHNMVTPMGEVATARAAATLGQPYIVSSMTSTELNTIAAAAGDASALWLQTYIFKDSSVTKHLVQLAESLGFGAIVLTVGCPVLGLRDRNRRNQFRLPPHVAPAYFPPVGDNDPNNPIAGFGRADLDPAVTWEDVQSLCQWTRLPVIAKGVLNPADVDMAVDCGLAGLMVSNHGGRQLDTAISSISALPTIIEAARGRLAVFADSGFRRGTDVLKALALGAQAVFLGRPVLWALAVEGETALTEMMTTLEQDLVNAMQLSGCPNLDALRQEASSLLRFPA